MATYSINPYHTDINPGTAEGAKLYNKAIEPPDDKLSVQQKNAKDVQSQFETDASNYGWGGLIGNVQINIVPEYRNILSNTREITLEMVQKHARTTWGTLDPWNTPLPANFSVRMINPAAHALQRPCFHRRA